MTGWHKEADVVIIGTGFAGLSAAIEASNHGCKAVIMEKKAFPGGNSIIADGGINAVDRGRQENQGIQDSIDLHFRQTYESGENLGIQEHIRYMVENSLKECVNWLEGMGVKFPDTVELGYGALWPRTHRNACYKKYHRGAAIIHALLDQMIRRENAQIFYGHKLVKIIRDDALRGAVQGVEVEHLGKKLLIKATAAVVLATGGFAADNHWVSKYDLRLAGIDTTNHNGATGEGIKLAQDIGADTLHMRYIQAIPDSVRPPFKGRTFYISSLDLKQKYSQLDITYGIFVNKFGKRYINEDARRLDISLKMLQQEEFYPLPPIRAGCIASLEEKLLIPKGSLQNTVAEYNSFCVSGKDLEWNKNPECLVSLQKPPFEALSMAPKSHFTMGGLRTKLNGEVLDRKGEVIPKLYAAGEVVGGMHGANRLGYNATPECILFGRLCGQEIGKSKRN